MTSNLSSTKIRTNDNNHFSDFEGCPRGNYKTEDKGSQSEQIKKKWNERRENWKKEMERIKEKWNE